MSPTENTPFVVIAGPCVLERERGAVNREAARFMARVAETYRGEGITFYFKSSYDKANRTSGDTYRGPGLKEGLAILREIKEETGLPLLTDVHGEHELDAVADVVDMIQIPAFLCRQTDLVIAAGQTGKPVNIKKGQFMAPQDMAHVADKVTGTGNKQVYITERGTTFGYNNLVVDMRSIPIIQGLGLPLIFDATHSVQLPGGQGGSSGGKREFAPVLARAAVASGCSGLFFETHPNPDQALSDGLNQIPLAWVEPLLETCLAIRQVTLKDRTGQVLQPVTP